MSSMANRPLYAVQGWHRSGDALVLYVELWDVKCDLDGINCDTALWDQQRLQGVIDGSTLGVVAHHRLHGWRLLVDTTPVFGHDGASMVARLSIPADADANSAWSEAWASVEWLDPLWQCARTELTPWHINDVVSDSSSSFHFWLGDGRGVQHGV